jgi:hypothetical protein
MTPLEHNKYVGLAQLAYGGLHLVGMIVLIAFEAFMFQNIYSRSLEMGGPGPPLFLGLILVFVVVITLVTSIPSIIAGYALLKRRPWARVAGIVGGVVAAMSFPIGTAAAVYTFWFLFSDTGKHVYGGNRLPPVPPEEWQPTSSNLAGG